jgi:hypothetical protein
MYVCMYVCVCVFVRPDVCPTRQFSEFGRIDSVLVVLNSCVIVFTLSSQAFALMQVSVTPSNMLRVYVYIWHAHLRVFVCIWGIYIYICICTYCMLSIHTNIHK